MWKCFSCISFTIDIFILLIHLWKVSTYFFLLFLFLLLYFIIHFHFCQPLIPLTNSIPCNEPLVRSLAILLSSVRLVIFHFENQMPLRIQMFKHFQCRRQNIDNACLVEHDETHESAASFTSKKINFQITTYHISHWIKNYSKKEIESFKLPLLLLITSQIDDIWM